MPPKARISGEMITDAAFEIVRTKGNEHLNARAIAESLSCSTQPILYYFHTVEEIRQAVFEKARRAFLDILFQDAEHTEVGFLKFCLRIVRFASREPFLFQFLFQCPSAGQMNLMEFLDSSDIGSFLSGISEETGISEEDLADIMLRMIAASHGLAGMTANGQMEYDAKLVRQILTGIWTDATAAFEEPDEPV